MRFAAPVFLWGLAGIPLLAALFWTAISRRRRAVEALAGRALLDRMVTRVSTQRRIVKAFLCCAAAAFLVAALARPQWGMGLDPVTRRGVDVVIAVDVSSSMLAEDLRPSRLEKTRSDAARLLELLDGDRVAVVAFAGSAATLCPLTLDYGAARLFIDALSPDILSDQGTQLPTALDEVISVFDEKERRFRAAVIFSDGEDHEGGLEEAAREAAEAGVIVHTVGVGTASGGPIPLRRPDGSARGYKTDAGGRVVTSRLEEAGLAALAAATGGVHVAATPGGGEIARVAEAIGAMEERDMQQKLLTRYEERFQIPLALALLCLVADGLVPERRRPKAARAAGGIARAAAVVVALALALAWSGGGRAEAASSRALVEEGNRRYAEGRYDDALKLYTEALAESPESPEIHLNIGNVFHKKGEPDKAREAYRRAWQARDPKLAESARYNSGTAGLAAGDLERAVEDFRDALRLDPSDADARRNLELALLRAEQMQPPPSSPQARQERREGDQQEEPQQSEQEEGEKEQEQKEGQQDEERDEESGESRQPRDSAAKGKETEEAKRILDALKGEDKPRVDPGRERRGEKRTGKDW